MDLRFRADWKVTLVKAEELGICRRLRMRVIKLLVNVSDYLQGTIIVTFFCYLPFEARFSNQFAPSLDPVFII